MKNVFKKYELVFLVIIIALAAFLRLYKLSEIPPGVNRDEASIGYTAYSLLKTGADEYGRQFPISFQSFGDWKLPLYIYVTVPFVKILGLNEVAVRLPSAIAGILAVIVTYFLVAELCKQLDKKQKAESNNAYCLLSHVPLISSLLLAITPWHIHLSRVESESNVTVFFMSISFLFFLKGLRKHIFLLPASVFFSLTYYTYHGNHITSTLLFIGAMLFFRKEIPVNKTSLFSLLIIVVNVTFVFSQTLLTADKTKLSGISIFGDPAVIHSKIEIPRLATGMPEDFFVRLRYNRITYTLETVAGNYIKSFSTDFLFIRGGGNRAHNIEGVANLYLAEAPFFYLGALILLLSTKTPAFRFLLFWLLVSPIAASITKDAPHTNRMFAIFPLPPLLAALGIIMTAKFIKKRILKISTIALIVVLYAWNFSYYVNQYFSNFPKNEWQYWGTGYKQLAQLIFSDEDKRVIVSRPETSPYIYLLFYSKYDPKIYQAEARRYEPTLDGFVHVKSFNRFEFRDIDWPTDTLKARTLIVDFYEQIPESFRSRVTKLANFGFFQTL